MERRAQMERKVNGAHTANDMSKLCERTMNDLFEVPREVSLHCISSEISTVLQTTVYCILFRQKNSILFFSLTLHLYLHGISVQKRQK